MNIKTEEIEIEEWKPELTNINLNTEYISLPLELNYLKILANTENVPSILEETINFETKQELNESKTWKPQKTY